MVENLRFPNKGSLSSTITQVVGDSAKAPSIFFANVIHFEGSILFNYGAD